MLERMNRSNGANTGRVIQGGDIVTVFHPDMLTTDAPLTECYEPIYATEPNLGEPDPTRPSLNQAIFNACIGNTVTYYDAESDTENLAKVVSIHNF